MVKEVIKYRVGEGVKLRFFKSQSKATKYYFSLQPKNRILTATKTRV
jgi:hypothetical protein